MLKFKPKQSNGPELTQDWYYAIVNRQNSEPYLIIITSNMDVNGIKCNDKLYFCSIIDNETKFPLFKRYSDAVKCIDRNLPSKSRNNVFAIMALNQVMIRAKNMDYVIINPSTGE